MSYDPIRGEDERIAHEVIGAAIEVHRLLGPGFLEKIYERALVHELALRGIHEAQLLSYLKASGLRLGLLINFNVRLLKDGIKRLLR